MDAALAADIATDVSSTVSADVGDQERERGRGHPVDPAGLADCARPDRGELLTRLIRESLYAPVVDVIRQLKTLVTAERGDVSGLSAEIDVVLGVNLELLEDLWRELIQAGPDAAQVLGSNGRE